MMHELIIRLITPLFWMVAGGLVWIPLCGLMAAAKRADVWARAYQVGFRNGQQHRGAALHEAVTATRRAGGNGRHRCYSAK